MHCPSCGQQQVTNDTKFCSRCGMPLAIVSQVLMYGGNLPQLAELERTSHTIYTRKNGVVFSLFWFIFFVPLLTSVFGGVFGIEILGELLALIGVFGALMIFIFSLVYLKKTPKGFPQPAYTPTGTVPAQLYPPPNHALPPQQSVPASFYAAPQTGSWRDTKDLEPASVTESTTRLLSEKEKGL
jgi:uncharacterized membrane protein YfcA